MSYQKPPILWTYPCFLSLRVKVAQATNVQFSVSGSSRLFFLTTGEHMVTMPVVMASATSPTRLGVSAYDLPNGGIVEVGATRFYRGHRRLAPPTVFYSPDGSSWGLSVSDAGALSATKLG